MEILIVFKNYSSRYSPLLQAFEVRRSQFFSFFFYIRDFIFICDFRISAYGRALMAYYIG